SRTEAGRRYSSRGRSITLKAGRSLTAGAQPYVVNAEGPRPATIRASRGAREAPVRAVLGRLDRCPASAVVGCRRDRARRPGQGRARLLRAPLAAVEQAPRGGRPGRQAGRGARAAARIRSDAPGG